MEFLPNRADLGFCMNLGKNKALYLKALETRINKKVFLFIVYDKLSVISSIFKRRFSEIDHS